MSHKKYIEDITSINTYKTSKQIEEIKYKFHYASYINSLHSKMKKPQRFSLECGDDVHCITVMPNRTVHFHDHPRRDEMIHLITFDMLKHPDIYDSKLPTCLKVLRGLRTRQLVNTNRYGRSSVEEYASTLIEKCIHNVESRKEFKTKNNPTSFREEILRKYKKEIKTSLLENLEYYGMAQEGFYDFKLEFNFSLTPSFMPSAKMMMTKNSGYRNKVLILDILVSPKWLINIWMKNQAIVQKNLVLNIIKKYPNGTFLCLLAKQSHGFNIIPHLAVVDFNRQAISWINDPERKDELLDGEAVPRMRRTKKEMEALKGIKEIKEDINVEENKENKVSS